MTVKKILLDVMDFDAISAAVDEKKIDLLVVGPEAPLAEGIRDRLAEKNPALMVFGPDQRSAQLEASKVFSYEFMDKASIPQAKSRVAADLDEALSIVTDHPLPMVIKADGLAAGKGVSIHHDRSEAEERCREIFDGGIFGEAGNRLLFQEFMEGREASLFAICNGEEAIYLPTACDYKRAFDGGEGPNTGGMGSYSPGDILSDEHIAFVHEAVVEKVLKEFSYRGILYVGLMIPDNGNPSVVEFNCRLGDPETQSVLPMMESDLLPYLQWSCGGEAPYRVEKNGYYTVPTRPGYTINVVLSAKGYPESGYPKGLPLSFPEKFPENIHIVHAGTKQNEGQLVSSGGRICNIVSYQRSSSDAIKKVYDFIDSLKNINDFSNLHYRLDIGR